MIDMIERGLTFSLRDGQPVLKGEGATDEEVAHLRENRVEVVLLARLINAACCQDPVDVLIGYDGDWPDLLDMAKNAGWLAAHGRLLAEVTARHRGEIPADETATGNCRHCGQVPMHPQIAALAETFHSCAWCQVRLRGGPIPDVRGPNE